VLLNTDPPPGTELLINFPFIDVSVIPFLVLVCNKGPILSLREVDTDGEPPILLIDVVKVPRLVLAEVVDVSDICPDAIGFIIVWAEVFGTLLDVCDDGLGGLLIT
jgi:hypothetical protein